MVNRNNIAAGSGACDVSKMKKAEAKAALIGAFDRASKESRCYLLRLALNLAKQDMEDAEPVIRPERPRRNLMHSSR